MTKNEADHIFEEIYPNYRQEAGKDYCKVQFAWSCFIDGLCKDGKISQKQYNNWTPPFKSREQFRESLKERRNIW